MTNYVNGVINTAGTAYTNAFEDYIGNTETVVSESSQIVSTDYIAVFIGTYYDPAIGLTNNPSLLNFGFIYGAETGLHLFDSYHNFSALANPRMVNGTSGVITGATGVFLEGRVQLNNLGEISGRDYGITLASQDLSVITNSGAINASGWAIFANGNTTPYAMYRKSLNIENTGTISGGENSIVSLNMGTVAIRNEGEISGRLYLEGQSIQIQNMGTILGPIEFGYGDIVIDNSGTISGLINIFLGSLSDFTINNINGTILSGVSMGSGANLLSNIDGTIHGLIDMGEGIDRVVNHGVIDGNINLGQDNDIYDGLTGTTIGSVAGGAGSDTYYTDDALIAIIETDAEVDTVNAAVTFRLANFVENLTLLGTGNFNGFGNSSANVINGNAGDNRLTGLAGNDTMNGDLGDDRMLGGIGNDTMLGGDGDDVMLGGVGNDTARGEDGDDVLNGLAGTDLLAGGAGLDTFVFSALGHTTTSTATADTVSDFIKGEDHIDLSAIDAKTNNAVPNDAFIFIGTAAFSNVAGQLRYSQAAGYTNIEMDVDGNSTVDGIIRLFGTLSLNAFDLVL